MREAFLAALKEDRYDEVTHRAYADWLEENGFDDEAVVHRRWSAEEQQKSEEWLDEFAKEISQEGYLYEDGVERDELTREKLIEYGQSYLENPRWFGAYLNYLTPDCVYRDRREFWKHFAVVTWRTVPEEHREATFFSCSC
jgi:uncharacterized protein (TIGR02996 family)